MDITVFFLICISLSMQLFTHSSILEEDESGSTNFSGDDEGDELVRKDKHRELVDEFFFTPRLFTDQKKELNAQKYVGTHLNDETLNILNKSVDLMLVKIKKLEKNSDTFQKNILHIINDLDDLIFMKDTPGKKIIYLNILLILLFLIILIIYVQKLRMSHLSQNYVVKI